MPDYNGPERRRAMRDTANASDHDLLIRIDERVAGMDKKLDLHIQSHAGKGGKVAQWVAIGLTAVLGTVGIVMRGKP